MMQILAVAAGGALGAMMRYGVTLGCGRLFGTSFPYGTIGANIIGSFAMGLLVAVFALREPVDPALKLFLTTGILGGFTTFSAFSLEAIMLYERKPLLGAMYVATSFVLSVGACLAGLRAIKMVGI